jgi:pantetheine-phosphate adenylyltransferase
MVGMNRKMNPDIETVFLMADAQHQAVASRLVKEIAALGGDISHFTTPYIAQRLAAKFPRKTANGKTPKVVALKQEKSKS